MWKLQFSIVINMFTGTIHPNRINIWDLYELWQFILDMLTCEQKQFVQKQNSLTYIIEWLLNKRLN